MIYVTTYVVTYVDQKQERVFTLQLLQCNEQAHRHAGGQRRRPERLAQLGAGVIQLFQ